MAFETNPVLGVIFHAIGGLAAASFYIPFRKVRDWSWETYWLVNGVVSWLIAPWVGSLLTVPDTVGILKSAPQDSILWCYLFGVLWGIGGLTFGLSMRYLGMSLGYALALGACAAFGTLIPPAYYHFFPQPGQAGWEQFSTLGGQVILGGVLLCLFGIAVCGKAGINKERELTDDEKKSVIQEFSFKKGVWVALFCGVMSACMSFGITAGKPIAEAAVAKGADKIFANNPVFIIIMAGGFTTNLIWCLFLNFKNKTVGEYFSSRTPILANIFFCALAGVIWYLQFFFLGMGGAKLGDKYDFSSWTLHMSFIIIFSNLWALAFREWVAASSGTRRMIVAGIGILVFATIVIGYGNYVGEQASAAPKAEVADAR